MTKSPGLIWRAASWALIVALGAPAWLTVALLMAFCGAVQNAHAQASIRTQYDSVADLLAKARPNGVYKKVTLLGYYSPGDGGGGDFTATQTVTGTNYGTRIFSGYDGWSWEREYNPNGSLNLMAFGVVAGADNTERIDSAIKALNSGGEIVVPPASYTVRHVSITNNIWMRGTPGFSELKHGSGATNNMLSWTATHAVGKFYGIRFNGNAAGQAASLANWWDTVSMRADGAVIEQCVFTNYVRSGLTLNVNSFAAINNTLFRNGKKATATSSICGEGLKLGVINSGSQPSFYVSESLFKMDSPSVDGYNSGGLTISGNTSSFLSARIVNNMFDGVGVNNQAGGNFLGMADVYAGGGDIIFEGNTFTNIVASSAARAANYRSMKFINNVVAGTIGDKSILRSVVNFSPTARPATGYGNGVYTHTLAEHNTFTDILGGVLTYTLDAGSTNDIYATFDIGRDYATNISSYVMVNNSIAGSITSYMRGRINLYDSTIHANSLGTNIIDFQLAGGTNDLRGLTIYANQSHGIELINLVSNATFRLVDNKVFTAAAGKSPVRARGVAGLLLRDNLLINSAGGAGLNIEDDSSGQNVGRLDFQEGNRIEGPATITWADIDQVFGTLWPTNVVQAFDGITATAVGLPDGDVQTQLDSKHGYTLTGWSGALSPADATTYFIGSDPISAGTAYSTFAITIPQAGTIKRVEVRIRLSGAGSAEDVEHYLRVNDTADIALGALDYDFAARSISATGLSQAVAAGDTLALKVVGPTWATNPTTVRYHFTVYIE